jgi:hypothetical protein
MEQIMFKDHMITPEDYETLDLETLLMIHSEANSEAITPFILKKLNEKNESKDGENNGA